MIRISWFYTGIHLFRETTVSSIPYSISEHTLLTCHQHKTVSCYQGGASGVMKSIGQVSCGGLFSYSHGRSLGRIHMIMPTATLTCRSQRHGKLARSLLLTADPSHHCSQAASATHCPAPPGWRPHSGRQRLPPLPCKRSVLAWLCAADSSVDWNLTSVSSGLAGILKTYGGI